MNETATHLPGKWQIWLSLIFAGVLLLSAAPAIPIVQNYRTIQRIEALDGYVMPLPYQMVPASNEQ